MGRQQVDQLDIEFLRPNEGAFGSLGVGDFVDVEGDVAPEFDDDEPQPRWLTAVAGLVVLGLLAGGVIAAAPWSDDEAATPAPTTSVAPTTVPAPTTTASAQDETDGPSEDDPLFGVQAEPIGWIVDPPVGWRVRGAYSNGILGIDSMDDLSVQTDLWFEAGATRTAGRWIRVEHSIYASGALLADGTRLTIGDALAVLTADATGGTRLFVELPRDGQLAIDSHDVPLDQLVLIATELTAAISADTALGAEPIDYGTLLDPGGPFDGLQRLPDLGVPLYGLLSTNDASMYLGVDSPEATPADGFIYVELGRRPIEADSALHLLADRVTERADVAPLVIELAAATGRAVDVYRVDERDAQAITWRIDGESVVSVYGYRVPIAELAAVAASARLATADEWRDALLTEFESVGSTVPGLEPPQRGQSGEFADGGRWRATLNVEWVSVDSAGESWWAGPFGEVDTPGTRVLRFAAPDVTVVVALARWPETARQMRVTVDGVVSEPIDMEQLGSEPVFGAIYVTRDDVPITVELLDDEGNVRLLDAARPAG